MPMRGSEGKAHNFEYVVVGRFVSELGLKGEIKIEAMTDFPERFAAGNQVYVNGHPRIIERSRPHKDRIILKLKGIDDVQAASQLRGHDLEIRSDQLQDLPQGEYYRFQVLGLDVVEMQGEPVGRIEDILPTGSNDVYIVRGSRGEILIPATDEVIKSIDLEKGQMVIELINGLI